MTNKPWKNEPDFLEWIDEETGYICYIKRSKDLKCLLGYVELPESNPMYGKDCYEQYDHIKVHGGVTFCEFNVDGKFWVGFDCAHADDFLPVPPYNLYQDPNGYKDINYVKNESVKLAKQLKTLEKTK